MKGIYYKWVNNFLIHELHWKMTFKIFEAREIKFLQLIFKGIYIKKRGYCA